MNQNYTDKTPHCTHRTTTNLIITFPVQSSSRGSVVCPICEAGSSKKTFIAASQRFTLIAIDILLSKLTNKRRIARDDKLYTFKLRFVFLLFFLSPQHPLKIMTPIRPILITGFVLLFYFDELPCGNLSMKGANLSNRDLS